MVNGIDWSEFIHMILDGAYAVDIRKTGDVAMFAKNQLGACPNPHTETEKFRRSLKEKIESVYFTPEDALAYPGVYKTLFDLAALFLPDWDVFAMKCCSLYLQLGGFNRALSVRTQADKQELIERSSEGIVRFIERWKAQFGVIGMQDIYERHAFIESVIREWRLLMSENSHRIGANEVIGLIYLGEWSRFSRQERVAFFQHHLSDNALFGAILSDMERLEGNREYNYELFAGDCRRHHPELYAAILTRCKGWAGSPVLGETKRTPGNAEMIRLYNDWTGSQRELLDWRALQDLVNPPKAADDEDIKRVEP